ncbi:MAG: ABC-F family ATP-binding cassette domain-containing protein [Candidatus Limnocylindrales bacterium]|jgi:ATP-binding cassette subfamily F protein 3
MSIVRLESVVREVGDFVILDHVAAAVAAGDRIGVVGPNGAGKTTLLRLVAGLDEPDEGQVHRKRGLTVAMLRQEAHVDSDFIEAPSLRQAVRAGAGRLEELERILRQMEEAGRVTEPEYERLQHEFDHRDGYGLDQRVEAALSGLGFDRGQWDRPPTNLSGGEQTRATLARLLLSDPDLLLLDEPTNHLDLAALEWLELHLGRRHGGLLVASHDRAFLDATVTRVWELRDRRLTPFRGSYSAYARQREERDLRAADEAEDRAAQIARERELVQMYRHQRKHSKMHEHEARLEALQPLERRRSDAILRLPSEALAGGGPARSYETVVRAEGLVVGYAAAAGDGSARTETPVARVPWLELRRGDRVGIVGPNGAGKTTLLRTIAGELPPLDGALDLGRNVQLTYLAQLRDAPIPGVTVLDAVLDALPLSQGAARSHLARFLFRGDDVFKEVAALSGGERSRLELALLFLLPANLLLLDEPTNHLDIPAREALEAFMAGTAHTLLVVSHDRRLLERVCDSLWVIDDGLAVPFEGGYRAWRAAVVGGWTVKSAAESEARRLHGGRIAPDGRRPGVAVGAQAPRTAARSGGAAAPSDRPVAVAGGSLRTPVAKLSKDAYRRRKAQLDEELARLTDRRRALEEALGDPGVHGNFVELRRVSGELASVDQALAAAEEAWLAMEEAAP